MSKDFQASQQNKSVSNLINFLNGGLSGILATTIVQPIDLVKTRVQLRSPHEKALYKTPMSLASKIYHDQGISGFYEGLSAAILRQATYTTIRLGFFNTLSDMYKRKTGDHPNFLWKLLFAMTAGGTSSIISTPTETVLIRMTSDARLPLQERRNYSNCFTAIHRIIKEEGVKKLWSGWQPTVARAIVLNGAQLSVYMQSKDLLIDKGKFQDGIYAHTLASINSAFFSTLVSIPIDNVKSHMQSMKASDNATISQIAMRVCKHDGVLSLWKGFMPYFFRLGPHTILTFVFFEYFSSLNKPGVYK